MRTPFASPIGCPGPRSRRASHRLPGHHVRHSDLRWITTDIELAVTMSTDEAVFRSRVLILAPVGRDTALTRSLLDRAGVETLGCSNLDDLQQREGSVRQLLTE